MITARLIAPIGNGDGGCDIEFADDWYNHWNEEAKNLILRKVFATMTLISNERDRVQGPHVGKPGSDWPAQ